MVLTTIKDTVELVLHLESLDTDDQGAPWEVWLPIELPAIYDDGDVLDQLIAYQHEVGTKYKCLSVTKITPCMDEEF